MRRSCYVSLGLELVDFITDTVVRDADEDEIFESCDEDLPTTGCGAPIIRVDLTPEEASKIPFTVREESA